VWAGCSSPADVRADLADHLAMGRFEAAEATLRKGLEAHPDDVDLLVAAAEFYLQPLPEERFKPRLALHYAMRADRVADNGDARAAALLVQAWRANGGSPLGDQLVADGLHQLGHRDQRNPVRLDAADPDLLEPTAQNLREQARRDRARASGEDPCGAGLAFVASAAWPLADGREAALPAFCAERRATPGTCSAKGLRPCTAEQRDVLCGPMVAVVGNHPSCVEPTVERCCGLPPAETNPGPLGP
jgi:tetratricopeptide (TPR) repeat protein